MFSIPRDLYVKFGRRVILATLVKITEYFGCVNNGDSTQAEAERMDKTKKSIMIYSGGYSVRGVLILR